jgi:hypothetical protein
MATANTKKPKAAGPATRGLEVITKRDGFRRAGCEWTGTITVPLSELTEEQVAALNDEPMLIVREVDITEGAAS